MARMRPLLAGNWKMNGGRAQLVELEMLKAGLRQRDDFADVAVCPPATLISRAAVMVAGSRIVIGGQDCHAAPSGAHTGDLAAEMLADAGARMVIVGHSERRTDHDEDDTTVRAKAEAGWRAGLTVVLCVGETGAERKAKDTLGVIESQLDGSVPDGATAELLVIAYEPVWAIGTGLVPDGDDIAEVHSHIRKILTARFGPQGTGIGILYGGSVKPDNAAAIFGLDDVDGGLIGGASLKAADFLKIYDAFA